MDYACGCAAAPNSPAQGNGGGYFNALSTLSTYSAWAVGSQATIVQQAAITGLALLNPGQNEIGNVITGDQNFAIVLDPSEINTSGWTTQPSIHANSAVESPDIPGSSGYDVKLYDNGPNQANTIAVVDPTGSVAHDVDALLYWLGLPINSAIGQAFLNSLQSPNG